MYTHNSNHIQGPQKLKFGKGDSGDKIITAKDIIVATGSVPLVPKGIEVDGSCFSAIYFCSYIFKPISSEFLLFHLS